MKLAITTENKLGITDDVLSLLRSHQADLIKVEVEDGKIYLHTQDLAKSVQGTIASLLMKIPGIKWVNQIDVLPGVETQNMLASLMQVMPDPVLGVNTKGEIAYANRKAGALFKPHTENHKVPNLMKHVFLSQGWQEKVNAAASSQLPVTIKTIAGTMLLEVQGIKNQAGQMNGAMLLFRDYEKIRASSYVMQGEEIDGLESLVYQSEAFKAIIQKAKTMANVEAPLSIVGETGTGKTLLAHACHSMSQRSHQLFTLIDCQAMKNDEMEVMLFGVNDRAGVLDLNQSGTLFFSHIEFMAPHLQQRLLQYFDKYAKDLNVRVMTSTSQKMNHYQQKGQLISELVLLLDVLRLEVLPLRERPEDIEPLIQHFLLVFNQQLGQNSSLSLDAMVKMKRYYWPGNATQLRHAIYKAIMTAKENIIQASDLDLEAAISLEADLEGMTLNEAVNEFERHFLQHWYQKYPSTRKLARQLGVSHTTIAQKIKKYNLKQSQD